LMISLLYPSLFYLLLLLSIDWVLSNLYSWYNSYYNHFYLESHNVFFFTFLLMLIQLLKVLLNFCLVNLNLSFDWKITFIAWIAKIWLIRFLYWVLRDFQGCWIDYFFCLQCYFC
jgi:hypothetical protein